jgi:hypothetical protein
MASFDPKAMADSSALGRMIDADEVAQAVAFLVSDRASAITAPICRWMRATSLLHHGAPMGACDQIHKQGPYSISSA